MPTEKILQCLPDVLATHGGRPAILVVGENSVDELTYSALADTVRVLAGRVGELGIERGDRVAIFASPSAAWIVACLALIQRGAVPVPIDTQTGDEQLLRIIDDAGIDHAFVDESRAERLRDADFEIETIDLDAAFIDRGTENGGRLGPDTRFRTPGADDVALLFFTSGTTGPPKGVPLRHRHLRFQTDAIRAAGIVLSDDRLLLPLPLHHVYPLVVGVLAPLSLGIPVILPNALTGPELIRAIRATGATIIAGVPRLYRALLDGIESRIGETAWPLGPVLHAAIGLSTRVRDRTGVNSGRTLLAPLRRKLGSTLRLLVSGGSPLDPALAMRLQGLGWDVAVGYGLTETAPILTFSRPGSRRVGTVGRPLDGVELRIDREAAPEDVRRHSTNAEVGEILARGPGVFDGYLHLDAETRSSFTDGWYRTGDLGWLDEDGFLHLRGRKSTMLVTSSGENISTEALEDSYAEHELIEEIGILKDAERLVAVVYPDLSKLEDATGSLQEAVERAASERARALPSWQRLDNVRVSSTPLEKTRLGKLKRHKLKDRYDELGSETQSGPAAPMAIPDMQADDRRRLRGDQARKTWELLVRRYDNRPMTPDSNLRLDLGIDSLGWLDLSMEIVRETGIELGEEQIARIESVRDLLAVVAERTGSAEGVKTPLEEPDRVLSEAQKRWLEPPSMSVRAARRSLYAVNRLAMRAAFRVRSAGLPDQYDGPPLVIAPNHSSFLDPFALAAALPSNILVGTYWGGWPGYAFRNVVFKRLSHLLGVVPIEPKRALMSSLAFSAAVLKQKRHLVWFPEGERSADGKLGELRPGIGALLEEYRDVAVMPVAIRGAFEAWPRDRRWPRFRKIEVQVGKPVTTDELAREGSGESYRDRLLDGLRRRMSAVLDTV